MEMWSPDEAEDGSTRAIPETLLRSKADCPDPPDALNAAIDKPVLTEVVGVLRAVHLEGKLRGKDKKRTKEDAAVSLQEACCYRATSPDVSSVTFTCSSSIPRSPTRKHCMRTLTTRALLAPK
jgi:hypothetical protein